MNTTLEVYVSTPFQESLSKAKDAIRYLLQAQVFTGISIRPQCLSRLEPFLCLHFIHLCDNGMDIGPSVQQCRNVSKVCDDELKQVKKKFPNYRVDRYLSNCAPKSPFDNCRCITSDTNRTYNCREGFYQNLTENGRCEPECNVWSPYHKGIVLITDILNIFAAVICVISGGAVLVLSWIRREKL